MYEGQNSPHLIGFVPTSMFTYIALRKIRLRIYVCQLVQAGAMRLVCDYTLLPFPKIYDAYVDESADRGGSSLWTTFQGSVMRGVWDNPTSEQQSTTILGQPELIVLLAMTLRFVLARNRFWALWNGVGVLTSGLNIKAVKLAQDNLLGVDHVASFVRVQPPHSIVFTHGDIASSNILIHGDSNGCDVGLANGRILPGILGGAVDKGRAAPGHLNHAVLLHLQQIVQG
ncbi:hypothetical protein ACO22_01061 [Paracoccidioides brasiliensis]|uniref:Uncharacterized protein n=1 Tax=Paracoccidioides brasiliensis TaxID=121759 RepID=A0A1D2JMK4_PARBR|nr:hypothetical protein ACO22_01061 [Paracoccidioides brasiliensis]